LQSDAISPDDLSGILIGKVCIAGIGNRLKGDDAAGPLVIDMLLGKTSAECVDMGVAPENFMEKIARLRPDTVLLVDALDFGAGPGQCRIFAPREISGGGLSTHALSIEMACTYLANRQHARIHILGIQPGNITLGARPSEAVRACVCDLAAAIAAVLPPSPR
jgi:hydrogenase 3 maturation protease